jgi:hypothetical protein
VRGALKGLIWLVVVAGAVALWVLVAPYHSTLLWWELRRNLFWLLPLVVVPVVLVAAWALLDEAVLPTWPVTLLSVLAVPAILFWFFDHAYLQDREYVQSVRVTADPVEPLGQRAPYVVAVAQSRPNLGDSPGDIASTRFLPQPQTFDTLVEARGWLAGYQTVLEQTLPLSGRGTGKRCEFSPEADARDGGWFGHNLGRIVAGQARWVVFDSEDAYGFCDGDTPKVVMPLKEQDGWLVVTERPAGVAVYDGRTGAVTVQPDAVGLPGATYPLTLARYQRESTHALSDLWDYVFGRAGWEVTDEDADVNAENNAEFILPVTDPSGGRYVTPLTGRGSATSLSAISTLDAMTTGDRLAPLTVHRLDPPWVSTTAIAQRIQADYQDIPNWQNLKILEIAPTDGKRWVATIGNDQNILYRVAGDGTLQGTEATCLYRGDGSRIRCGTLADQAGNGIGTQYGQNQPGQPPATGDLGALTNEQLIDLINRAQQEAARRLTAPR